jgi:hypothetical protein
MLRWKSSLKPASGGSSTVTLTDDFNRTDTLLESVATDEGWYWVNAKSAPDTMSVSSNKARVTNSNDSTAYYADYSLGTDAEVQTTVTNEYLDRSSAVSVTARYTDNDNRYYVNRSHNSDDFRLYSRVGGSNTEIGTRYTADPSVPYTMKLVCNGDQISVYIDGVLRIGPVTDTSITTGNYVGIGGYNNGNNRIEVDDFVASSLSASASGITLEASAENEAFTGYNSPYNISVSYPAVSADDILLAIISTERRIDFNGTPPTGWTKVIEADGNNAFNPTQAVYWKRATGSAAATSETWGSLISGSQSYHAWVGAYSGCVTSVSPIDASAGVYQGYATSWSISITTQTNDAMILAVAGSDSNVRTFVWSDGTELIDKVYQSTGTVTINEKIESTAGATTRAGTMSAGQSGTITAVALKPASGGYLIDENFEDNVLPSDWTFTGNSYTVSGGELYGVNGSDYVTFDVPAAMQDEFWMKAVFRYGGSLSKDSYQDIFEILDSGGTEFIQGRFWGTKYNTNGTYTLEGSSTGTSLKPSAEATDYYLWFHFVKNGTSEMFLSTSSTRPTTDSSTEVAITCSTDNTSADKFKLKLGYSNGTRPITWEFFIGNDTDPDA